jgi:hypothetical protein
MTHPGTHNLAPDLILYYGDIVTLWPERPPVSALAVPDDLTVVSARSPGETLDTALQPTSQRQPATEANNRRHRLAAPVHLSGRLADSVERQRRLPSVRVTVDQDRTEGLEDE